MVRVKMFPRAEILAESDSCKRENCNNRNAVSGHKLADGKVIDGLPNITLNVENLHIHLDERMDSHNYLGSGSSAKSDTGSPYDSCDNYASDDFCADFDDCGLDCDHRCEHCVIGTGRTDISEDDAALSMDELIGIIQKETGLHRTIVMLVIDEILENLDRRTWAAEKKGDCLK